MNCPQRVDGLPGRAQKIIRGWESLKKENKAANKPAEKSGSKERKFQTCLKTKRKGAGPLSK